jgi:hypothetical protein
MVDQVSFIVVPALLQHTPPCRHVYSLVDRPTTMPIQLRVNHLGSHFTKLVQHYGSGSILSEYELRWAKHYKQLHPNDITIKCIQYV